MTEPSDERGRPAGATPTRPASVSVATTRTVDSIESEAREVEPPPAGPWVKYHAPSFERLPSRIRRRRRDAAELDALCRSLDPAWFSTTAPDRYGLTDEQLAREITRLRAAGWAPWELRHRFGATG